MFHLISKHQGEIYQTREGVFHLISKHQGVIYQTREGVFHLISKHQGEIYQTREGVFHLISKHQGVIYQTREGVFHLISKHQRVNISNTRRTVSSDIHTPGEVMYLTSSHSLLTTSQSASEFHRDCFSFSSA